MTVKEVQQRTGCGRKAVEQWLRSGALRGYRPTRHWLILEKDLEEFLYRSRYVPKRRVLSRRRRPDSLDAARARRDRAALEVLHGGSR